MKSTLLDVFSKELKKIISHGLEWHWDKFNVWMTECYDGWDLNQSMPHYLYNNVKIGQGQLKVINSWI